MNQSEISIEENPFQNYFEIKSSSKLYNVFLSLSPSKKIITFSISHRDLSNKIILYEKSLSFKDISIENKDFFIPFKNDIVNLFKFIERLFMTKLVSIKNNYNNSMDFLSLLIYIAKDNEEFQIQYKIPKKCVNNINISSSKYEENNMKNIYISNFKKRQNCDCAPVPFLTGVTPKPEEENKNKIITGENNIFYFTKKKYNFCINIYKYEIKSEQYKELVLKVSEKDDEKDENIEYCIYLNLMDFINIAKSYYTLFNYNIDDIYDDFLVIFHNKNIDIESTKNKIKLFYLIPNIMSIEGKNMYYKLCLKLDKIYEREYSEVEFKIQEYYFEIFNFIQKEKRNEKLLNEQEKEDKKGKKNNNISKRIENKKTAKTFGVKKEKEEENINKKKQKDKKNKDENIKQPSKRGRKKKNIHEIKKFDYLDKNVIAKNNEINFTIHSNNKTNKIEKKEENNNNNLIKDKKEEKEKIFNNKDININTIENSILLKRRKTKSHFLSRKRNYLSNNLTIDEMFKPIKKIIEPNVNIENNNINIPIESILILSDNILINKIQCQLILEKAFNKDDKIKEKKFLINLIYEINMDKMNIIMNKEREKIISEFYRKIKDIKNVILLILTEENYIFGGYTKKGFILNNYYINNYLDKDAFIFSINKMKTYGIYYINEYCISCYNDKFPEFKEQIIFDSKNIKKGKTGLKEKGFLTKEDFELNMGNKIFNIKYLQLLNISINI